MYALKIRKSDLAVLTLLNDGVAPVVEKKTTYLIVDTTGGPNLIVDEKEFDDKYAARLASGGPYLFKLNKRAR